MPNSKNWMRGGLMMVAAMMFGGVAMGVVNIFPASLLLFVMFVFVCGVATGRISFRWGKPLAVGIVALCFSVAALDLTLRFAGYLILRSRVQPPLYPVSELPVLKRYPKNKEYRGKTYGDMAAMIGEERVRQWRDFRFVTDPFGFRNEAGQTSETCDLVILGDSYGVGVGTSQEDTLAQILIRQYGVKVYNLSIAGVSPWEETINFMYELPRMNLKKGTTILWLLFSGNDLEEYYGDTWDEAELPRETLLQQWYAPYRAFKRRSPIRRMLHEKPLSEDVVERSLPDGNPFLFYQFYIHNRNRTSEEMIRHANYPKLVKTLEAMSRLARAREFNLKIVLLPSKEEIYDWILEQNPQPFASTQHPGGFAMEVSRVCKEQNLEFMDFYPPLRLEAERAWKEGGHLLWWRDDTHWNPLGQKLSAQILVNRFQFDHTRLR